jgi:serine/threonine-protein kinase
MEKTGSGKKRTRSYDFFIGLGITIIIIALYIFDPSFLRGIELKTYDLRASTRKHTSPGEEIAIVVIDDESISRIGRWPWPRSYHAEMIDHLKKSGAKIIALEIILTEPEESTGLKVVRRIEERFVTAGIKDLGPKASQFSDVFQEIKLDLDNDLKLEKSIRNSQNVVFPLYFTLSSYQRIKDEPVPPPQFLDKNALKMLANEEFLNFSQPFLADGFTVPLKRFGSHALALGHINVTPDEDGVSRREALVIEYLNQYYPSFALQIASRHMGLNPEEIKIFFGEGVKVGPSFIGTDERVSMLVSYNGGNGTFNYYPFHEVLDKKVSPEVFRDKIVLIGATAAGIAPNQVTPFSANTPGVERLANVIENIIHTNYIVSPTRPSMMELGIILIIGLFASIILTRFKAFTGSMVSLGLLVFLIIGTTLLFLTKGLWINVTYPTLLLIFSYIGITSRRFFITEKEKEVVEEESDEANKMLGLAFQGKGMLDLAFEKFRKIPVDDEVKDILYNLGLDFERKRMISKTISVYEHLMQADPNYKDVKEKVAKLQAASSKMAAGAQSILKPKEESTVIIEGATENPTLGRYEIVGELGKGAMGVVYKGIDPKINRTVAIKTIRFEQDFESDEIEDVKKRFFTEAETVGRLLHPNIVTIFDVGEDWDLSYIAMEILDGEDLIPFTKKKNLLPMRKVVDIVIQSCEALNYAHEQGVVHRDIKPGNIMVLNNGQVKITDFGIARITSGSKTQTAAGIVLGTPSYMSPEQVAGKPIDGRSDIFSLGVLLYELLTGERPFKGENIMTLLNQIATQKFPSPKQYNPKIPDFLVKVIEKALAKDLNSRFQKASEMAAILKSYLTKVDRAIAAKKQVKQSQT